MNEVRDKRIQQVALVQQRHDIVLIDKPSMENLENISEDTVAKVKELYGLTLHEARLYWVMRNDPVDLMFIQAHRTHIFNLRKKLKPHNIGIRNLWRGVYQLSIVGSGRD